jgi:hypothetical protein
VNQYTVMLIAGLAVLLIGLNALSEFNIMSFAGVQTVKPPRGTGILLSVVGITLAIIGVLGSVGWLGQNGTTDKANPGRSASASPTSSPVSPSLSTSVASKVDGSPSSNSNPGTSAGVWYLDRIIEPKPNGSFQVASGQVGSQEEVGKTFRFEIIVATPIQTAKINNQPVDKNGDVIFSVRPGKQLAFRNVIRS